MQRNTFSIALAVWIVVCLTVIVLGTIFLTDKIWFSMLRAALE